MNQNISAAETLFSAAHPDIKKITNISALILSLLFVRWDCAFCFFVESGRFLFRVRSCPAGRRNRLSGGRRYSPDDKKRSLIYVPTGSLVKKVLVSSMRATSLYWGGCWRRRLLTARQRYCRRRTAVCGWTTWFRRTVTSLPSSC